MSEPVTATNPNEMGEREAMGLPEAFVDRIDRMRYQKECAQLASRSPEQLAVTAGDPALPHLTRFAAGSLLALLGDPRIDVWSPEMVDVPGGTATIGLRAEHVDAVVAKFAAVGVVREWIEKEVPAHPVELAPYRMARYPVTNLEYRAFLLENPGTPPPTSWTFGAYPAERANHPVWTVTPEDADAYAAWLSARTGRAFRLPTEDEWEHAAAGPGGRTYPWGERMAEDCANTVETGPLTTTPVGVHPAGRGPFGTDDMAGNVEEYVADDYRPYPGGTAVADDLLRSGAGYRVARGGSFTRYADLARCRRRHGWYRKPMYAMGFRLAETPGTPAPAEGAARP
ncbi:formylglycine-generating enzyme family protein [Streptomyces sp. NPDC059740]|uniref:formylglycine-generating enzyme family protein n=1 Tax=Streptomyces sp. NPDC059740 TaxID=3346926 RepID=UPI0036498168